MTLTEAYQHIKTYTRKGYSIAQCRAYWRGATIEDILHNGNDTYSVMVSGTWYHNVSGKVYATYDTPGE